MPTSIATILAATTITVAVMISMAHGASANCVDPVTGTDFSSVPTAILDIEELAFGSTTLYHWVINLCQVVSTPAGAALPCVDPGYINQYTRHCWYTFPVNQSIVSDRDGVKFNYGSFAPDGTTYTATIHAKCGPTLALQNGVDADGNPAKVIVNGTTNSGHNHYSFELTTSAVCTGPVPPPPPPRPNPVSKGIALKVCDSSLSCGGSGCTTHHYAVGCSAVGNTASALRFCTGAATATKKLHVQVFENSTSCAGNPTVTSMYVLGQCVPHIEAASSTELKECN